MLAILLVLIVSSTLFTIAQITRPTRATDSGPAPVSAAAPTPEDPRSATTRREEFGSPERIQGRHTVPPAATLAPHRGSVRALTDSQLCELWQTSYLTLRRCQTTTAVLSVSEVRFFVLDELAARDPRGFSAWIASGARAASNPARHIRRSNSG